MPVFADDTASANSVSPPGTTFWASIPSILRFSFQTAFIPADVIHRPCYLVGAGTALVFLPLTHVRERSADWRYFLVWHLVEGAHVPCGHAASRRSTVASSTPGPSRRVRTGDFHPRDPGGFRRPSSGPPRPSCEGGPS